MATLSLRITLKGEEKEFDFNSSLETGGSVVRSTPSQDLQFRRVEGFGSFVGLTDKESQTTRLYIFGRSSTGYSVVRVGNWMFPTLVKVLKDFGLIRAKELDAALRQNRAAIAESDRQEFVRQVTASIGATGIVLNKKQEAQLRRFAGDQVKARTPVEAK